jgi:hypothetical protein
MKTYLHVVTSFYCDPQHFSTDAKAQAWIKKMKLKDALVTKYEVDPK